MAIPCLLSILAVLGAMIYPLNEVEHAIVIRIVFAEAGLAVIWMLTAILLAFALERSVQR